MDRRNRKPGREQGSAMVEFALVMAFLVPLLAGVFMTGASLVKSIQAGQVCRNANVLVVRGINMAAADDQQLVIKAAQGLGMNLPGTYLPDPSGKGLIILSRVYRVSPNDCLALGLQANQSQCPNLDNYVFTNRISIGNTTLQASVIGNPSSPTDGAGNIPASQYVTVTGDRASDFPDPGIMDPALATTGLLYLALGAFTYVSEAAFDISSLNIFSILPAPRIYARNLS